MNCQKCRCPLKLDGSLDHLNAAAYDVLISSASQPLQQQQQEAQKTSRSLAPPQDRQRKELHDRSAQGSTPPVFRRHGGGGSRDAAMSFIYLTESHLANPGLSTPAEPLPGTVTDANTKSRRASGSRDTSPAIAANGLSAPTQTHEMARLNKLFDILSSRSDIDHPICVDCCNLLVAGLQSRLEASTAERDAFAQLLKELRASSDAGDELRAQEEAVRRARADEADAAAALERLEREKAAVDAELAELEAESRRLDAEEEEFWQGRNEFADQLSVFRANKDSVGSQYDHDGKLHERLRRTNVYNDTFFISHDGSFATINGLRLGRLSSQHVDWPEINAAWGHALLLLVTVADKLGFKFQGYEPKPMGSTSKIFRYDQQQRQQHQQHQQPTSSTATASNRLGSMRGGPAAVPDLPPPLPPPKKHVLELYSSGDVLGLIGINRSLNAAMLAFLELVRQLGSHVQRETLRLGGKEQERKLPYVIEGDRIHDVSIKLGIGGDENWTKACKLTLTCCKFLLAHASNMNLPR